MKKLIIILEIFLSMFVSYQFTYAQWIQRYNGPANDMDISRSIAVDGDGNVYVTGDTKISGTDFDYATIKYGSTGVQQWIQRYNGPGNFSDFAHSIAVDGAGNVYVTGQDNSSVIFNPDYATIKYNKTGIQQWIQRYNGPGNADDVASSIVVDGSGNVYVTGTSGIGTLTDYTTIKYNSNGDSLWVRKYNGPGNDVDGASLVAIDNAGNVYVIGTSTGIGTNRDFATIKYNSSGDQQWIRRYNGPGNYDDHPQSLTIDASGNTYVTGYSTGIGSADDFVTIKYNSIGDSLWVKRYNGPGNDIDQAFSVALDIAGNVYVTGQSSGTGTSMDFATIKYDGSGVQQWIQRFNGPDNYNDMATKIEVDDSGNIYVAGTVFGRTSGDYAVIKYNSSGIQKWIQRYDGPASGDDEVLDMKLSSTGNIYVTGFSTGIGTGLDYATIKFPPEPITTLNLSSFIEGFYNNLTNKMVKDTITVYLRNNNSPFPIVDSARSVLDSNGNGIFNFPYAINGISYYIVIKHRNSIETWSNQGIMFINNQLSYDFTSAANKAYGNNLVLKGSEYCIFSGDVNQDGLINLTDLIRIHNDVINNVVGYVNTDLNGDDHTNLTDLLISHSNSVNFIKLIKP